MSNFLDFATPLTCPLRTRGAGQYELPPKTTYYYTVESMDSSGRSDEVKSSIKAYTTR
jgi:hypothetical protein